MPERRVVRERGDWVGLAEVIHDPEPDDERWATQIVEAAKPFFPTAGVVGMYSLDYAADLSKLKPSFDVPRAFKNIIATWQETIAGGSSKVNAATFRDVFRRYHFTPTPVMTSREIEATFDAPMASMIEAMRVDIGLGKDGIGIISHPSPGRVTVLHTMSEVPLTLRLHERQLLTRVALHLETAARARSRPDAIVGELTSEGRLLWRDDKAPNERVLETFGQRLREARSRKRRVDGDALALWSALLEGRVSIVPRGIGKARYVIIDNPPATRALHALTPAETAALTLAARGLSTKLIAYGLGLSSSTVSMRLASAAAKVGVLTRAELVRLAALLTPDPRADLPDKILTAAERDVLELLQLGLSNQEIAKRRSRSIRTIANQVAALLRKTKSTSRRALIVT